MVSTSKILTVSYGTFSCTLEGFDDSFDTMKAIAEYFRDLAAEDRYFGAEPPVPDAEMLARIAEREIARRVEAREERGSIVLRAAPYGAVAAPLAPYAAPQMPQTQTAPMPPVAAPVQPQPQPQTAEQAPQPIAEALPVEAPETIHPATDTPQDAIAEAGDDTAMTMPDTALSAAPLRPTQVPHPDPDSVAAKLQRIRDVVTKSATVAAPQSYSEDEHADSFLTETAETMEAALELDDQLAAEPYEDDGDEIAALLSRLAQEVPEQGEDTEAEAELIADDVAEPAQDDAYIAAPVMADADTAQAQDEPDDLDADADRIAMPQLTPHHDLSPEDEAALRRELAAVEAELVEINRDADDTAPRLQDEYLEDEDSDELTSLFDEDEDDEDEAATAPDSEDDNTPLVLRDPRERLVRSSAEDDVSRLMAKAESALTEPESASRRNAIAHLRAAVAATKAEHSAGSAPVRDPAANAFRDDLADVVRPRRPVGDAGAPTPRPADTRPAPLKLVAEQRVDLPETRSATPVRPRRVSLAPAPDDAQDMPAQPAAPAVAEDGFAAFARKMGATALPDLMEAAAAYLIHVEGREEFSRPQLMNKARQATDGTLNREDGLRALGQLLRQGKIQKIRGGRFAVSEDIGFKPEARRVG